jgi:DNA-binding CsgD family transcriptional regulator
MRWDEALASRRWAQALTEGATKAAIAAPLRSAHRLADEMSAGPLRQDVEQQATLARISVDEPHPSSAGAVDDAPEALSSLTPREREILGYLVAGRTYAEIAAALFISEKTVSVHVSNLLRKTGTSSRHDVAALASRLGYGASH